MHFVKPCKETSCMFYWKGWILYTFQRGILPFSPWKSVSSEYIQVIHASPLPHQMLLQVSSGRMVILLCIHLSFGSEGRTTVQTTASLLKSSGIFIALRSRSRKALQHRHLSAPLTPFSRCIRPQADAVVAALGSVVNVSQLPRPGTACPKGTSVVRNPSNWAPTTDSFLSQVNGGIHSPPGQLQELLLHFIQLHFKNIEVGQGKPGSYFKQ